MVGVAGAPPVAVARLSALDEFRSSIYTRISILFVMFLYLLSPINLIPAYIPILGFLDDLAVVLGCLYFCFGNLPPSVPPAPR